MLWSFQFVDLAFFCAEPFASAAWQVLRVSRASARRHQDSQSEVEAQRLASPRPIELRRGPQRGEETRGAGRRFLDQLERHFGNAVDGWPVLTSSGGVQPHVSSVAIRRLRCAIGRARTARSDVVRVLVRALPVSPWTRCGACCLSFLGPRICWRVGGTCDSGSASDHCS